jgi:hypothetical protein
MPSTIIVAAAQTYGVVSGLFSMAVNFAISYVVTRVFGAKAPRQQDNGVRQQIPPSSENRIPVAYGEAWMGGTFVDAVMSTDNQAMYYVLAISNISPNGNFTFDTAQFYYGDRLITFAPGTNRVASLTDGAGNVDTKINNYLYFNLYTSDASGTITTVMGTAPNLAMGGSDIPVGLRWPASGRQMNGLAFAIIYLKYNTDAGTTGLQPITFKVNHSLNLTGVAKPGSVLKDYLTNTVYGGAVPLANVNTSACDALDAYADQLITYTPSGGGSATQARYRINGVIDTGETALNNIDHILSACDSWLSYQAETGQWSPVINKAETSSFSFDDSNIIGEIRVSATDITQSINQVEASFPWKGNKDKPSTVFLETPAGLLYPNEPVNKYTTNFTMVNDSVQATYLANRMLEQAREDLIVSFSTAYTGIQVNAGDVVSVTNSAYGWTNKLFRVIKVNEASLPDGNLGARIEMNEYNAQVYDDFSITQFTPAPNSDLQSGYYFPALNAPTFSDEAPSASPPTFSVTCQLPTTVRITSVTLFYTTEATPTANDWKVWATQLAPINSAFQAGLALKFPNVVVGSDTYYFAFTVANELSISKLSAVSTAFNWATTTPVGPTGPTGSQGPSIEITGYTGFNQNSGGAFTPPNTTIGVETYGITSPTYTWTITGATPTFSNFANFVITPLSNATSITASVVVNGSNLTSPLMQSVTMPVTFDGAPGQAGANGMMSAFPTIYRWTSSSTAPARPTTTSTYDWATGSFTPPTDWFTSAPSNTTPGDYLWSITVPLNVTATTVSSTLDWTNTSYPIRAISYNGDVGAGTYVVVRVANDSSPPTNAEVNAVVGRNPAEGDVCTVSYNNYNNAVVYRYIAGSWSLFTSYITGSLIVENTITASKLSVTSLNSITANTGTLTVTGTVTAGTAAVSGTTMTGAGGVIYANGNFAFGNTTTNISYNGTQMTLNGNVVATENINLNATLVPASATTTTDTTLTTANTEYSFASASINTGSVAPGTVFISATVAFLPASGSPTTFEDVNLILYRDSSQIDSVRVSIVGNQYTTWNISYADTTVLSANTSYTYTVKAARLNTPNTVVPVVNGSTIYVQGVKR